jgi:hypothetical protein
MVTKKLIPDNYVRPYRRNQYMLATLIFLLQYYEVATYSILVIPCK